VININVLVSPGVTVPLESLSAEEQLEIQNQMDLVSEVAELEITELDEIDCYKGGRYAIL